MSVSTHDQITGLLEPDSASEMPGRGALLRLLGTRPHSSFAHPLSGLAHHGGALKVAILLNVFFNLTDLTTSYVAFQAGLAEGNSLVLAISAALGLNILESLALMKVAFLALAATVALVGARSTDRGTRNLMLGFLLTSTFIFLVVSLSNVRWIIA